MATFHKILGQLEPIALISAPVYTVPPDTQAIISTINVCNLGIATDLFTIWAIKSGGTTNNDAVLYYEVPIVPGNNTFQTTAGITLGPGESIYVWSQNGTTSFNVFGKEIL